MVKTDSGSYLTFKEVTGSSGYYNYEYTGVIGNSERASVLTFSGNKPAMITLPIDHTYSVEEIPGTGVVSYDPAGSNGVSGGVPIADSETKTVTVTNTYTHGTRDITVQKLLDGYPADWGINDSTVFYAKVFDKRPMVNGYMWFTDHADGTYTRLDSDNGNATQIISFAAAQGITLKNMDVLGQYEIRELDAASSVAAGTAAAVRVITSASIASTWLSDTSWTWGVMYSANNGKSDQHLESEITITAANRYKLRVKPPPYTVTYDANWPDDGGTRTGSVPVDGTDYGIDENGTTATVKPVDDSGELVYENWAFLGWDEIWNAEVPSYPVIYDESTQEWVIDGDPSLVLEGDDVTLYAIWAPVLPIKNVQKEAERGDYKPGGVMQYTITADLPDDVRAYDSIRIEDVLPSSMTYTSLISAKVGSKDITPVIAVDAAAGTVSFTIGKRDLADSGKVTLVIWVDVDGAASGMLTNTVNVYKTPVNGSESTTPDKFVSEAVVETIGPVVKSVVGPDLHYPAGTESSMSYEITFKLPGSIDGYEGIKIEDLFPDGMVASPSGLPFTLMIGTDSVVPDSVDITDSSVSFVIGKGKLAASEDVELTLTLEIESSASGILKNTVNVYIMTTGGVLDTPSGVDDEPITPTPDTYAVIYDPNWPGAQGTGSAPVDDTAHPGGETVPVADNTKHDLTKDGWTLVGWDENPDADPNAVTYQADGSGSFPMPQGTVTLYAIWEYTGIYAPVPPPTPASITLTGTKVLNGRSIVNGEFQFVLYDVDNDLNLATVTSIGDTFSFDGLPELTYTSAGTYRYTIREVEGTDPTITYTKARYNVTVRVSELVAGELSAQVISSPINGYFVFTNTYTANNPPPPPANQTVELVLDGTKTLGGSAPGAGNIFGFVVRDENDVIVSTGISDAAGNITFSPIHYDENDAGSHTYTYEVSEVISGDPGIVYDPAKKTVTVAVDFDSGGILQATPTYAGGGNEVMFNNTVRVPVPAPVRQPVELATLTAGKSLYGGGTSPALQSMSAGAYCFVMLNELGVPVAIGLNRGASSGTSGINFTPVYFTEDDIGTHPYTIVEVDTLNESVNYDDTIYTINVTVAIASDGSLSADWAIASGQSSIGFINWYAGTVPPTPVPPTPAPTPTPTPGPTDPDDTSGTSGPSGSSSTPTPAPSPSPTPTPSPTPSPSPTPDTQAPASDMPAPTPDAQSPTPDTQTPMTEISAPTTDTPAPTPDTPPPEPLPQTGTPHLFPVFLSLALLGCSLVLLGVLMKKSIRK